MPFWRGSKRTGAAVAAFAMLLQLGLSFGHAHDLTLHRQGAEGAATTVSSEPDKPSDHSQPAELPDEDGCPICITIHMVAGGALPVSPAVALRADFNRVGQSALVQFDLIARRHAFFQTRAPPHA